MVRIVTLECPTCGTVVAGNVLEDHREMKCPGLDCETVLQFADLPDADRRHILEHKDQYELEEEP